MATTLYVNYLLALDLYKEGTPFRVRLVFKGWNTKRKCMSDCWWEIEYRGGSGFLCNWGKTGTAGRARPIEYGFQKGVDKLLDKINSGYVYDSRTQMQRTPKKNPLAHMPTPFCDIRDVILENGKWRALGADGHTISVLPRETAISIKELLA